MISKHPHFIIIGAGIVGASLAYHLARRNAHVTLIDKALKPAADVTEKSFAWINVMHNAPEAYLHLRQQAIADWHRIEDELTGQLKIDWSGALTWHEDTVETERIVSKLVNAGSDVRFVDQQEIRRLEPNLKKLPDGAMFAKSEGAIDPRLTPELLIKAARESGADIQLGNEVLSITANRSRIAGVVSANGNLTADIVILATGTHTNTLCQPLGVTLPITVSPAILLSFHNHRRFINRIVSNPFMEIRAASNTLTLAAEDYIDESIENSPQAIAQRTLHKIKKHWQGAESLLLANVVVGERPIPGDGLPIIGRAMHIDGLYFSVMHAGITLAAIAGRLAAAELMNNQEEALLSHYRTDRFK